MLSLKTIIEGMFSVTTLFKLGLAAFVIYHIADFAAEPMGLPISTLSICLIVAAIVLGVIYSATLLSKDWEEEYYNQIELSKTTEAENETLQANFELSQADLDKMFEKQKAYEAEIKRLQATIKQRDNDLSKEENNALDFQAEVEQLKNEISNLQAEKKQNLADIKICQDLNVTNAKYKSKYDALKEFEILVSQGFTAKAIMGSSYYSKALAGRAGGLSKGKNEVIVLESETV